MIYIKLMGGLGNQLFQIFTGIAYSFKHNIPFKIIKDKDDTISPLDNISLRPTYFKNFLYELSSYTCDNIDLSIYNEASFTYNNIPYIENDFKLHGYFQSPKYFESYKQTIFKLINLESQKISIKEKYITYFNDKTISLHFRIGDYIKNPDCHPILSSIYYVKALKTIFSKKKKKSAYKILYFNEKRDKDHVNKIIKKLQQIFPTTHFIQCSYDISDWEQMLLMSCCNHNIIANSTFSWWGSYFNTHPDKIVCYPNVWFGPLYKYSTNDLFPENWIKI